MIWISLSKVKTPLTGSLSSEKEDSKKIDIVRIIAGALNRYFFNAVTHHIVLKFWEYIPADH